MAEQDNSSANKSAKEKYDIKDKKDFRKALRVVLSDPETDQDNPVYKVIPTFPPYKLQRYNPSCDICDTLFFKAKASHICIHCQKLMCNGCTGKHKVDPVFEGHVTLRLQDSGRVGLQCRAHRQEQVMFYCSSCGHAICVVCALSVHDEHQKIDFQEYLLKQKQVVVNLLQESYTSQQGVFELKSQIEGEIERNDEELQRTSSEITAYYNVLQRTLASKHDKIQRTLNKLYAEKQECLVNSMQELHDRMFNLLDHTNAAKQLTNNDIKLIQVNPQFIHNFQEALHIDRDLEPISRESNAVRFLPSYDINVGMLSVNGSSVSLKDEYVEDSEGTLKLSHSLSSSSLGFYDESSVPNSSITSPLSRSNLNLNDEHQQQTLSKNQYKTRSDLSESHEDNVTSKGVAHIIPSLHLGPASTDEAVLTYTIDFTDVVVDDLLGHTTYEAVPIGIAFKNEHKIAVTQWGSSCKEKHLATPYYYPAQPGMVLYSLCTGVAGAECTFDSCSPWMVVCNEGLLYVTDNRASTRTVLKYTEDGTLQERWHSHRFTQPGGIVINKGQVIVTDMSNKQIRIFREQEEGHPQMTLKLGQPGRYTKSRSMPNLSKIATENYRVIKDVWFENPQFVTCNSVGWLIVSDSDANRVRVFDRHGKHLYDITDTKGYDTLKYPMDVAVDLDDNIYIADYGNDRVIKFNKQGTYLNTIFNRQKHGILKPRGIALYGNYLAVSCHNENGIAQVKVFDMGVQLQTTSLFGCPCDWFRLCSHEETLEGEN